MILKDEFTRSVGAQYATGEKWRNNSRKNEQTEPKQKQHPVVDVSGGENKIQCCKEQYFIETWNVRSMNQDKLEVVKQEMTRANIDILGISELKWTGFQFSSVSQVCQTLCDACKTFLSITTSRSLLKLMPIVLVIPSIHLILCLPVFLPSVFPSIRAFSNESTLCIKWPTY